MEIDRSSESIPVAKASGIRLDLLDHGIETFNSCRGGPFGQHPNHQIRLALATPSPGGPRASMPVNSSRWRTCPRILWINCGSSAQARAAVMQDPKGRNHKAKPLRVHAITLSFPPQSGQVSILLR